VAKPPYEVLITSLNKNIWNLWTVYCRGYSLQFCNFWQFREGKTATLLKSMWALTFTSVGPVFLRESISGGAPSSWMVGSPRAHLNLVWCFCSCRRSRSILVFSGHLFFKHWTGLTSRRERIVVISCAPWGSPSASLPGCPCWPTLRGPSAGDPPPGSLHTGGKPPAYRAWWDRSSSKLVLGRTIYLALSNKRAVVGTGQPIPQLSYNERAADTPRRFGFTGRWISWGQTIRV